MRLSRRRWLLLIILVLLALPLIHLAVARHKRHQFRHNWEQVQIGMSKDQVKSLLGSPLNTYAPGTFGFIFTNSKEQWAWGPRRLISSMSSFPYFYPGSVDRMFGPASYDYVIEFNPVGEVLAKHPPRDLSS